MDLTFTNFEKCIIKKMMSAKKLDERLTSNYFISDDYIAIEISDDFLELKVIFNNEPTIDFQMSCFDSICERTFLFNKLESQSLIGFVNYSSEEHYSKIIYDTRKYNRKEGPTYFQKMGQVEIDGKAYTAQGYTFKKSNFVVNADIAQKVYRYANSWFYISSELKELVNHNFISKELKRYKVTRNISIVAIIVSFLIGLLGLYKEFLYAF